MGVHSAEGETPIVLFAYERVAELAQVLRSLRANGVTRCTVISDGADGVYDRPAVDRVRTYIRGHSGIEITLVERSEHLGPERARWLGIREALAANDKAIFLTDDSVVARNGISWLVRGLQALRADERVSALTLWSEPPWWLVGSVGTGADNRAILSRRPPRAAWAMWGDRGPLVSTSNAVGGAVRSWADEWEVHFRCSGRMVARPRVRLCADIGWSMFNEGAEYLPQHRQLTGDERTDTAFAPPLTLVVDTVYRESVTDHRVARALLRRVSAAARKLPVRQHPKLDAERADGLVRDGLRSWSFDGVAHALHWSDPFVLQALRSVIEMLRSTRPNGELTIIEVREPGSNARLQYGPTLQADGIHVRWTYPGQEPALNAVSGSEDSTAALLVSIDRTHPKVLRDAITSSQPEWVILASAPCSLPANYDILSTFPFARPPHVSTPDPTRSGLLAVRRTVSR